MEESTSLTPVAQEQLYRQPVSIKFASFNIRYDPSARPIDISAALHSVKRQGLGKVLGGAAKSFFGSHHKAEKTEEQKWEEAQVEEWVKGVTTPGVAEWGEKRWTERRTHLTDMVKWEDVDVIGFQEALKTQVGDLVKLLSPVYDHVGVGRDDGKEAGEYVPIFWKRERFELVGNPEHFWLSKTPHVPGSVDWDAALTRMVTLIQLRDKSLPAEHSNFFVLNTHWDHLGQRARYESGKIIVNRANELISSSGASKKPIILMGDFNSYENESGYQVVTAYRYTNHPVPPPKDSPSPDGIAFLDFRHALHTTVTGEGISEPFGEDMTFTGFQKSDTRGRIDFLMIADNGAIKDEENESGRWKVTRYGVLDNRKDGGFFVSDHRMVVGRLDYVG